MGQSRDHSLQIKGVMFLGILFWFFVCFWHISFFSRASRTKRDNQDSLGWRRQRLRKEKKKEFATLTRISWRWRRRCRGSSCRRSWRGWPPTRAEPKTNVCVWESSLILVFANFETSKISAIRPARKMFVKRCQSKRPSFKGLKRERQRAQER